MRLACLFTLKPLLCALLLSLMSAARAEDVTVTVHWDRPGPSATGAHYSLNLYKGPDSAFPTDPRYRANLNYMGAPMLRIHNGAMSEDSRKNNFGWVDTERRAWDRAKIHRVFSGLKRLDYPHELMINIPTWPGWMKSENGMLSRSEEDRFARFCADLVRIVNRSGSGRYVRYWEPINEKDDEYAKAGRIRALVRLWQKCYIAMKATDPRIEVGGLAFQHPHQTENVFAFIDGAAHQMDFLTMHTYVSGNAKDPTEAIYDRTDSIAAYQRAAVRRLAERTKRRVPVYLDEYNISWNPPDPRMNDAVGMVFDALVIVKSIEAGSGGTMAWNEMDGWYGKTDNAFNRRPSAHLFHLLNRHFIGRSVATRSTRESVRAFAVRTDPRPRKEFHKQPERGTDRKALLWINRSGEAHRASTRFHGEDARPEPSTRFDYVQLSGETVKKGTLTYQQITNGILLPEHSVTLVMFAGSR